MIGLNWLVFIIFLVLTCLYTFFKWKEGKNKWSVLAGLVGIAISFTLLFIVPSGSDDNEIITDDYEATNSSAIDNSEASYYIVDTLSTEEDTDSSIGVYYYDANIMPDVGDTSLSNYYPYKLYDAVDIVPETPLIPLFAPPLSLFCTRATIASNGATSFAIKLDGTLWGWGFNFNGELGDGTRRSESFTPVFILDNVISVSAGFSHTMAIKYDGSLWGWGNNRNGQLGNGTTTDSLNPIHIMDDVATVIAGHEHTLAIKTDGSLWAWGGNRRGALGDGTTISRLRPIEIMSSVVMADTGGRLWGRLGNFAYSVAIRTDGTLWTWGYCPSAGIDKSPTPVNIMNNIISVSTGNAHTMAIASDGSLWAWGYNFSGQLGDGTTEIQREPIRVIDNRTFTSVSAGDEHTVAIASNGDILAWGRKEYGDIGVSNYFSNAVFALACGSMTMIITSEGDLYVWGRTNIRIVDDDTSMNHQHPMRMMSNIMMPSSIVDTVR